MLVVLGFDGTQCAPILQPKNARTKEDKPICMLFLLSFEVLNVLRF